MGEGIKLLHAPKRTEGLKSGGRAIIGAWEGAELVGGNSTLGIQTQNHIIKIDYSFLTGLWKTT